VLNDRCFGQQVPEGCMKENPKKHFGVEGKTAVNWKQRKESYYEIEEDSGERKGKFLEGRGGGPYGNLRRGPRTRKSTTRGVDRKRSCCGNSWTLVLSNWSRRVKPIERLNEKVWS